MKNLSATYLYRDVSYFKGLNTLRFIAAYLVLMHHSETMKMKNGIEAFNWLSLFGNGGHAVTFFFVLSGFLITYILLKEKNRTQTISVKNFYLKRVFRIWPLYYLLVVLGTIIIPFFISHLHIDYDVPYTLGETWYYFVFFLPGLVTFFYGHHLLEPLWSIGVEEIFYLFWGPLFKFIKKNILALLLSVIILMVILKAIPYFVAMPDLYTALVGLFSFEAMAVGGLGAYFVFNTRKDITTRLCYNRMVQVVVYTILFAFLLFNINIENKIWRIIFDAPILSQLLLEGLFLYLIIGVALAANSILKLEHKLFSYFGEISYGIYMYHMTVISLVVLLLPKLPITLSSVWTNCVFYILVTGGTLFISHMSKKYFEDRFLKLKKKLN